MSKEEILERLFKCETIEDFYKMDEEILKIKESGDNKSAQYLWQQLFMIEEGIMRSNYQNKYKDE